jgi:hypothetical protein
MERANHVIDNPLTDVKSNETKSGWRLQRIGRTYTMLANWALEKSKSLFEEVFGVHLLID